MKELIQFVAARGMTQIVYYGFQVLTFVVVFIFAMWFGKKYSIDSKKAVLAVVVIYPLMDLWKRILWWIESGFGVFGGENNVRIFVYVPLLAYIVAKVLKIEYKRLCDFLAPCVVLTQGVGHFGCIFPGCCYGYPCEWGIYNLSLETYLFPIQPLEAIIALAIVCYLVWKAKEKCYIPDGKLYPIMMVWFGSTRFLCEFLRDNEKLLFGCSSLALHALFMCIVGLIWLHNDKKRVGVNRQ